MAVTARDTGTPVIKEGLKGLLEANPQGVSQDLLLEIARTRVAPNEIMPGKDQVLSCLRQVGRKKVQTWRDDDGAKHSIAVWYPR